MGSIADVIKAARKIVGLRGTPITNRPGLFEIEESPRVSVESDSALNIRVHRVTNGWVVNTQIEANGSYESETHVCGVNDNVVEKITELVSIYKLNA